MKRERFDMALERLEATHWSAFEHLAATFFATEYPNLRTLACSSGDKGRDGVLFTPDDQPATVLQYSVTRSWEAKIADTVAVLLKNKVDTRTLIYATNQIIGPAADALSIKLRKDHGIALDVRDRSYFLDRLNTSPQVTLAAEELARLLVDPVLEQKGLIPKTTVPLRRDEAEAAVMYLALQLRDDASEKGLTKLAFDALVKSALRGTSPQSRLPKESIVERIKLTVPDHSEEVETYAGVALLRLVERGIVKYSTSDKTYSLSRDERVRAENRAAEYAVMEVALDREIAKVLSRLRSFADILPADPPAKEVDMVRRILSTALMAQGESFVTSVQEGRLTTFTLSEMRTLAAREVGVQADATRISPEASAIILTVESLLVDPGEFVRTYLRGLANSHTLLSFVKATPNVQAAIVKMFSEGELWLDTSLCLPLFAELLLEPDERWFNFLLSAGREAGLKLYVTPGVVEEVERHMNRARSCSTTHSDWHGPFPFLYTTYLWSGRPLGEFSKWLSTFRGEVRPKDDVTDALREEFGIEVLSLEEDLQTATVEERAAVHEVWCEIHEKRRGRGNDLTLRMASHDLENYLGVLRRRKKATDSTFGYTTWWLTLDRAAYRLNERIADRLGINSLDSPALSPDFLINYLALGPVRRHLDRGTEHSLPLMLDLSITDDTPPEFVEIARAAIDGFSELPDRVARQRVRDALDKARVRQGLIGSGGISGLEQQLQLAFDK